MTLPVLGFVGVSYLLGFLAYLITSEVRSYRSDKAHFNALTTLQIALQSAVSNPANLAIANKLGESVPATVLSDINAIIAAANTVVPDSKTVTDPLQKMLGQTGSPPAQTSAAAGTGATSSPQ